MFTSIGACSRNVSGTAIDSAARLVIHEISKPAEQAASVKPGASAPGNMLDEVEHAIAGDSRVIPFRPFHGLPFIWPPTWG